jgi:hypothetical protein
MLRNLNKEGKEVGRFVEGLIPSGQSDRQEGHDEETIKKLKRLAEIWYPFIQEKISDKKK